MPSMADVLAGYGAGVPSYDPSQGPGPWYPAADIADTAVGMAARGLEHVLVDPIKELGQASETMRQTGEYNARPGFEMATNLAGAGMPFAAKGAAGIFGGRLSKTADLKKLAQAEEMAGAGASMEDIFRSTGWFQGPEGAWKYEISDQAARFRPMAEHDVLPQGIAPGREALVEHFLNHPRLFEAYPEARSLLWKWEEPFQIPGFRQRAGIVPEERWGFTNPEAIPEREQQLSGLLHEIQHYIQQKEGFARGGSPQHPVVVNAMEADLSRRLGDFENRLDALYGGRDRFIAEQQAAGNTESPTRIALDYWRQNPNLHGEAQRVQKAMSDLATSTTVRDTANKYYRQLGGEVESRNVQTRQHYTDAMRQNSPPWYTEDVPRAEQLLRLGD